MSDCATKRFGKKEEFQILSSQNDTGNASYHKQFLWMAHWTKASSSAEPQNDKSCSPFEEIYSKDPVTLPFDLIKARLAGRVMLGMSNAGPFMINNVCQVIECKNVNQVDRPFESSVMQKNVNLYAANAVVSERSSVHKLSDISVNSHKVLSSNNMSLLLNHFPMLEKRWANLIVNSNESPHWSSEKKIMFAASRKENEKTGGTLRENRLGASGGCQKQQYFHRPLFGSEHEMQPVNASATSRGNHVETTGRGTVSAHLLQCEEENLCTHRVNSAMKLREYCELPNAIDNTLTTKSKGETLAIGKPSKDKLTGSKQKAPCLFEMLTLPSKSQATCFKDPASQSRSCVKNDSCSLGAQKQISTKTDTLYSDTHRASGIAATSIQKDYDYPNKAKSEQIAISSIRGVSSGRRGNETINASVKNHNSYSKATCASKQEWSMPKTSNMNIDLVLFQISRMRNPISSALIESPICSEPSDKWLKRLRHNISDPHFPCSKRSKVGDDPPLGGACTVFGQELDYDMDKADMINHVKEDELRYGRLMNQQNPEDPHISSKSLNNWIGRWCQDSAPVFHGTSNVQKQTPKSNMPPDDLEGQFPSIAAMAMMVRVMNKLRPCELHKRGPLVVWKTQGL